MAGETSLARQLKKLAVPQTTLLITEKIKKSFLFDHRDAAGLDRDIIFAYGTTGLDKLKMINPSFEKFEQNLFSLSYKEFERSVQSDSVNKKLDENITEFLRMLSPYFLIRAAHEALEWLVYRFHIHMYNVDELVASVLPHCQTSVFVRVIQLLNLDDNNRWSWLKPVQKSGVHLEYSAILNHFNSDRGFRKFVCDLAPNVLKVYGMNNVAVATPVISFSTLTIYYALDICEKVTDNLITFLFPYILAGLKSNFNKYISCSYVIIGKIMMKVKLSYVLVSDLLLKVFENVHADLLEEAFKLLLVTYQQQELKTIPEKLFSVVWTESDTLKYLEYLTEKYEASSLVNAFVRSSVPYLYKLQQDKSTSNKGEKFFKFFKSMLYKVKLNEKCAILLFDKVLKLYLKYLPKKQINDAESSIEESAKYLLKFIEIKYPESFDKAINSIINKEKMKVNKRVCKLINDSVCSLKYKMLPYKQTLVLGLNHVNGAVRENAVQFLMEESEWEDLANREFISDAFYERLHDDCSPVVMQLLSHPEFLFHWLERQKMYIAFEHILRKKISKSSNWYCAQMKCLDIILGNSFDGTLEESFNLWYTLLPFLFPVNNGNFEGLIKILDSNLCDILPVFQIVKSSKVFDVPGKKNMSDEDLIQLNLGIISCAKKYVAKLDQTVKSSFLSFLNEKVLSVNNNSLLVIYSFILGHGILTEDNLEQKLHMVKSLLSFLKYILHKPHKFQMAFGQCVSEHAIISSNIGALLKGQFPSSVISFSFLNAIKSVSLGREDVGYNHWPNNMGALHILNLLFEFCIVQMESLKGILSESFRILQMEFIRVHFSDMKRFFWFLSQYWCNFNEQHTTFVHLASLKITETYFQQPLAMDWFFDSYVPFISLIKAVVAPAEATREVALDLLSSLLQNAEHCEYALKYLAEDICRNSEEIKIDLKQCYYVIHNWLVPAVENSNGQVSKLPLRSLVLENFLKIFSDNLTPYDVKYFILLSLEKIDSINLLSVYIPILKHFIKQLKAGKESTDGLVLNIVKSLLNKYTPKTASCLVDKKIETTIFFECLQCVIDKNQLQEMNVEEDDKNQHEKLDVQEDEKVIKQSLKDRSIQMLTLKIITKEFFSAIPSSLVQQKLLNTLIELYIASTPDINSAVGKVLRKLCTYAHLILKDFQMAELVASKGTSLKEMKKSKFKENILSDNSNELNKGPWEKVIVLLEIIQNKKKLEKRELLVPELFQLLNKSLNFDSSASVEYLRQLILSTIYNCCQELGTSGLDERQFQVELIVQCIRSSTNPKTHHESLLLLNLAASMFPDYVLSNVMSIFTFMGSSLVRQDDSYSFQVISQTIETIVPSLLAASSHQEENEAVQVVASVIRVFVESLSDIPGHRQLPLFTKLITTLDASKYLWIPLGQICDQYATVFHNITSEDVDNWKIAPTLEFAINLHKHFSPSVQMDTCIKLVNFLGMLPDSKDDMETNEVISKFKEPFNVISHSDKQLQVYKHNVLSYINIWLSSQAFVSQVSELDLKAQYSLEEKYEQLLEATLSYLQHQINISKLHANDQRTGNNLMPLLYNLVNHINSLLPCNLFIRVVRGLFRNTDLIIQKNAIELLISKLEQHNLFSDENYESLVKLLKPLIKIVKTYTEVEKSELVSSAVNQQTALYSLHLLAKVIGHKYPLKFFKVLQITIKILSDKGNQPELAINALLCLAQLCVCLNVKVLLQLNSFMPIIVDLLHDDRTINLNECLVISIITALQSLIENIGQFLSSYMESLVTGICKLAIKYSAKKVVCEKLHVLRCLLAKEISLRVLLSSVESGYTKLLSENKNAVIPLMEIFEEKLNCCKYEDIEACSPQLQKFYILLLDFRNLNSSDSPELVKSVEDSIISCLKTFILKLSVTRFRTFFQKVYQWATSAEEQEQNLRIFTFYKLTCELSQSLKNLFVLMAKYFLRHAANILDQNNCSKTDNYFEESIAMSSQLLNYILDTLNFCLLYDDSQLLDKENFEILMQPLVDQLENIHDEVLYQEMVESHLSSCIAHFMAAVSDHALWKKLNYQILLKTRHDAPKVRFAALQVIRDVVQKMGDNYLTLLPESIPFLAEIMEDESFEVEQECQSVIIEMEKILGEPIRKYF